MKDFRRALKDSEILLFDGGLGTTLQRMGLPSGQSPERFGLDRPEDIEKVHREYLQAGACVLTTNTFGGTSFKLGPDLDVTGFNRTMAQTARKAAGEKAWIAGSIGPTGKMVKPLGEVCFHDLVLAFRQQVRGLVQGGVDFLLAETHFDLAEVRAVVVACREECDLPVAVSMTFEEGVSLTGTDPRTFAHTMRNMGVDLIGTNCSSGPEDLVGVARELVSVSLPVLVQPNAGVPRLEGEHTIFDLGADDFAGLMAPFFSLGVKAVGGCCGTTPKHIGSLAIRTGEVRWDPPERETSGGVVVTSRSAWIPIGWDFPLAIVGERINPTGKPELTQEFQNGKIQLALDLAQEQTAAGASALDINVGAPMTDEPALMRDLVLSLASRNKLPCSLDSSSEETIREGLMNYPGSPLVNSISGEAGKMDALGPLCRKFGAPFILLPLGGGKLPATATERLGLIEKLLAKADDLQIPRSLIMVDALALTVSSKPESAKACLEVIRYCKSTLQLPTILGLSNISFGLPARELINSSFLTMAMEAGLSACIANPNSKRLRETVASSEVLLTRDPQASRFISSFSKWKESENRMQGESVWGGEEKAGSPDSIKVAVLKGDKDGIISLLEMKIRQNVSPFVLVDEELIPAITEVGEKYERKEYFLPQLLLSAETMQKAFDHLRPFMEADGKRRSAGTVVLATVEGDIHDIGKNIVALMLKNHGFEVIDLGKDVPASRIVQEADSCDADLVGLSALMTTTMTRMADVVRLLREHKSRAKVIIGGAVVTREYAEQIGADGYADDAVAAVKVAGNLLRKQVNP
ncbi:MAG: homocysteine S-methyltransferase family protein [Desulfovibrionales bacterium]